MSLDDRVYGVAINFYNLREMIIDSAINIRLFRRLETIVDNAEDSGTPIIMVTANPEAVLASRCDLVINTISRDRFV